MIEPGMPIDQEISGGRVLVLAHAGLHQRRPSQAGKTLRQERPRGDESESNGIVRIRIELRAVAIKGQFETAVLEIRDGVSAVLVGDVDPDRHVRRSEYAAGRSS